jgi:hypothetical protein
MSNQDLNELKSINNQLEQLQNQKHIIQQKLQDENDMMMVENHLFSQSEIQELIQEIEKDFPDFKINIDYKANNLKFIHKENQFYNFPEKFNEITKKDVLKLLINQLELKPIYKILINENLELIDFSKNKTFEIKATDKFSKNCITLSINNDFEIKNLKIEQFLSADEVTASFNLKKYDVRLNIISKDHYDYNRHNNVTDKFMITIEYNKSDIDFTNLQNEIQNGLNHLNNTEDIKDYF